MMTKTLMPYYLSRAILCVVITVVFLLSGHPVLKTLLTGGLLLALFLYAPHSGRYAVHPEFGITALRRDERTQAINDWAARNAFVFAMLALAAIAIYCAIAGITSVPLLAVKLLIPLGALVYFASDVWQRKSQR